MVGILFGNFPDKGIKISLALWLSFLLLLLLFLGDLCIFGSLLIGKSRIFLVLFLLLFEDSSSNNLAFFLGFFRFFNLLVNSSRGLAKDLTILCAQLFVEELALVESSKSPDEGRPDALDEVSAFSINPAENLPDFTKISNASAKE